MWKSIKKSFYVVLLLSGSVTNLFSQNLLNGPEGIVYDAPNKRYLVANATDGVIVQIDSNGVQSYFLTGLSVPLGMHIVDSTLYVSTNSPQVLKGFDLETSNNVINISIPSALALSGISSDTSGNLYIANQGGSIYKVRISTQTYTTFANSGLPGGTQGLLVEPEYNRLLVVSFPNNSPIVAVDLYDSTVSTVVNTTIGQFTAITKDNANAYYVCSWRTGGVHKYNPYFVNPPELFSSGHTQPTGLCYTSHNHTLAVSNYGSNSIDFIPVPENYLYPYFTTNINTGNAPLNVQFYDGSLSNPNINSWAWDFDNDGTVDSYDQHPTFTFNSIGSYTVSLEVSTDSNTSSFTREEYIDVFDGESAVKFNGEEDYIYFPPIPSYNLTENFTIEVVINPEDWGSQLYGATLLDKSVIRLYITGYAFGPASDYTLGTILKMQDGTEVKFSAPDSTIELNIWQHIAISYNSSLCEFKMYVNGVEQPVSVVGSNPPSGVLFNNENDQINLGNDKDLFYGYEGNLDEFRLWDITRSPSEILQNIDNSLSGTEAGLIGYWNMNEGSGNEITDLTATGNNGILASGIYCQGVHLNTLTYLDKEHESNSITAGISLKQNYPNPFNPTTTVNFEIPEAGYTELVVYNIIGEKVKTFYRGELNAGTYSYTWNGKTDDGNTLPSGIYLCNLRSGEFIEIKKMTLIK